MSEISGSGQEQDPLLQAAQFNAEFDQTMGYLIDSAVVSDQKEVDYMGEVFKHEFEALYPVVINGVYLWYGHDLEDNVDAVVMRTENEHSASGRSVNVIFRIGEDGYLEKCDGRSGRIYYDADPEDVQPLLETMAAVNEKLAPKNPGILPHETMKRLREVVDQYAADSTAHTLVQQSIWSVNNEYRIHSTVEDVERTLDVLRIYDDQGKHVHDQVTLYGANLPGSLQNTIVVFSPKAPVIEVYRAGYGPQPKRIVEPFKGGSHQEYSKKKVNEWKALDNSPEYLRPLQPNEAGMLADVLERYITDEPVTLSSSTLSAISVRETTKQELYDLLSACTEGALAISGLQIITKSRKNGKRMQAVLPDPPERRRPYLPIASRFRLLRTPNKKFFLDVTDPNAPEDIRDTQFIFDDTKDELLNHPTATGAKLRRDNTPPARELFRTSELQATGILKYIRNLQKDRT